MVVLYRAKLDPKGDYEAFDYVLVKSMLDEITAVYDYARRGEYSAKGTFHDVASEELRHLGEFNAALIQYYMDNPAVGKEFFKGVNEYCVSNRVRESDPFYAVCKIAQDVVQDMAKRGKV